VSRKPYVSDRALLRLVPRSLAALAVNAVTDREVTRALVTFTKDGLAEASVRRFPASLSSFFAWAVRERLILARPDGPGRPNAPGYTGVPEPRWGTDHDAGREYACFKACAGRAGSWWWS